MIIEELPVGTLWVVSRPLYRTLETGEFGCVIPEGELFLLLCQPLKVDKVDYDLTVLVLGRCGVEEFIATHFSNGNLMRWSPHG